jgi:hypothetical protein
MEVRFCPQCGQPRWDNAMFCGSCGYAFDAASGATGADVDGGAAQAEPEPLVQIEVPRDLPRDLPPPMPDSGSPYGGAAADRFDADATAPYVYGGPAYAEPYPEGELVGPRGAGSQAPFWLAVAGVAMVAAGASLVALAAPSPGANWAQLTLADALGPRAGDAAYLLGAGLCSLVAAGSAAAAVAGRLRPGLATVLLILAGAGGMACSAIAATGAGWNAAGAALPGPVLMLSGGSTAFAAAVVGWLTRE